MQIPVKTDIIYKGDPRIETFRSDTVMTGNPDAVVRPRDWQEVKEILKWCNAEKIPATVCGGHTSMSGSSVAETGVLITTDHFNKIIDIGKTGDTAFAVVEPGVVVGQFQKIVEEKGFHYPVAPTSCDDAFIGGTVATNATGEDFYKYGPTRNFVRELSFIKVDGSSGTFKRSLSVKPIISKGLGGYYLNGEEIDLVIGSEGTLAVITRVVLELLPTIPKTFIIFIPFGSNIEALKFIDDVNNKNYAPRSMEFIDSFALSIMRTHPTFPRFSNKVRAFVYLKGEGEVDVWFDRLKNISEESIVATTDKQKNELHNWRHHIPATISETHKKLEKNGGGKVSGDWWVPRKHMLNAMKEFYAESEGLKIDYLAYAHLGDGHPHAGYLCKNAEEKNTAEKMLMTQCLRAVALGGGVAGEHGIGKIKRSLLLIQHSQETIAKMRAIKTQFDPNWILGAGNIFQSEK